MQLTISELGGKTYLGLNFKESGPYSFEDETYVDIPLDPSLSKQEMEELHNKLIKANEKADNITITLQ